MIELHKKEQELIDGVMENFDFEECEKVMKYLDWKWAFSDNTPTIEELKESARDRIDSAIFGVKKSKESYQYNYSSASGGLQATVYRNRYNRITSITLEFVLTEWRQD